MSAIPASRSPSDMWRKPRDETTKERSASGSWRDRRLSKGSGEGKGSQDSKGMMGNWRVREQDKPQQVDVPVVYGASMPPECTLQGMYKNLKVDNANFTTWLVESVYPTIESLPYYITLSRHQAKDHSKYDIMVKNTTELARQIRTAPPSILTLLERLIDERSEYTYWMSQKLADDVSTESHLHYIEVLKETKTILAERIVPEASSSSSAAAAAAVQPAPSHAKATDTPSPANTKTLRKRKISSATLQDSEQRKAAKTEATPSKPEPAQQKRTNPWTAAVQTKQQADWRQVVTNSCGKLTAEIPRATAPAPAAKPLSYAAALRVAVVA